MARGAASKVRAPSLLVSASGPASFAVSESPAASRYGPPASMSSSELRPPQPATVVRSTRRHTRAHFILAIVPFSPLRARRSRNGSSVRRCGQAPHGARRGTRSKPKRRLLIDDSSQPCPRKVTVDNRQEGPHVHSSPRLGRDRGAVGIERERPGLPGLVVRGPSSDVGQACERIALVGIASKVPAFHPLPCDHGAARRT